MNYKQALALSVRHDKKLQSTSYFLAKPQMAANVGTSSAKVNTTKINHAVDWRKAASIIIEKLWRGVLARREVAVWKLAKVGAQVAAQAAAARSLELAQLKATLGHLRAGLKPSAAAVVRGDVEKLRIYYRPALATIVRGFQTVARRRAMRWRKRVAAAVAAAKEAQAQAAAEAAQAAAKAEADAIGAALKLAAAEKRSESLELLCDAPCAQTPQQRSHSSLLDSRWCS